ncbi:MAG: hypothetical protein HOC33_05485 [Alphaproteobacteria bacterium]|nr:hypothetical protein [Alphaproteobacteria bacterium]MBT4085104.1 hypothetical protein [Alphaproteobacteria bacterium]MBT4543280.1 hypothetical protein [Alphaproteobacteria bacterium]
MEITKHLKSMKWTKKAFLGFMVLSLIGVFGLHRLHNLNTTPIAPANFSWINKVEIYGLGVLMSALAYPIYPEVAHEHMMLYTVFDEGAKIIEDDFFLCSTVVQDAIKRAIKTRRPYRLSWPASAYQLSLNPDRYREARIALALNGGHVRVEGNNVIVKIKIAYPKKSYAPLIPIPGIGVIGVEEGLFWILQQEKWYHTGYVEWVAPMVLPN